VGYIEMYEKKSVEIMKVMRAWKRYNRYDREVTAHEEEKRYSCLMIHEGERMAYLYEDIWKHLQERC
jgi:hypothetical protein